jgi:transposase
MTRRKSAKFKTQIVLEDLKERMSMTELAQKFELHPQQISNWKREVIRKKM